MRIVYVDADGLTGPDQTYAYYGDLYRALQRRCEVVLWEGPVGAAPLAGADVVVLGMGWFARVGPEQLAADVPTLRDAAVPVVALLHKPQHLLAEKLAFCRRHRVALLVDYFGAVADDCGVPVLRQWLTADPALFRPRPDEAVGYDVGFSGALHGNGKLPGACRDVRLRARAVLQRLADAGRIRLWWNGSDSVAPRIRSYDDYARQINRCRAWLATTGPVDDVGPRYFELALSRTLIVCNRMPASYRGVFRDGENCVMFANDASDLEERLLHYLDRPDECARLVQRAYDEVAGGLTLDHMANQLLAALRSTRLLPAAPPRGGVWTRSDYADKFARLREAVGAGARTIVEVGAHYGEDSVRLAETFRQATVHAFEPDPRNVAMFVKHVRDPAVRLWTRAVADHRGRAPLFRARGDERAPRPEKYGWIDEADWRALGLDRSGASSLVEGSLALRDTVEVDVETLDRWAEEALGEEPIDLLWVDAQGGEPAVLRGAGELLRRTRFVWIEYGEDRFYPGALDRDETIAALRVHGFYAVCAEGGAQGDILFRNCRC